MSIVSSANGLDRVPLETLGPVGDVTWSHARPTGCLVAAWTLGVPANFNHRALSPGRRIEIHDGLQKVWSGVLTDPERGLPWSFSAQGHAALATAFIVTTSDPNLAIDAAIIRGLPWVRVQTLPTPTLPMYTAGSLADLLNQVAAASGMRWWVGANQQIVMDVDALTPSYMITASDTPGGRTISEYGSALYGRFVNSANSPPSPGLAASSLNAATGGPAFGRREILVDLTPAGPITGSAATALLDARFPLVQARADFTGSLQVRYGDITSMGGVPVRLSSLTAGQRVRVIGSAADPNLGELLSTTKVEFVVGQVDLADLGQTVTLTPLGAVQTDLAALLEVAAAPDTSDEVEAVL